MVGILEGEIAGMHREAGSLRAASLLYQNEAALVAGGKIRT
jgi:hypothetical protein